MTYQVSNPVNFYTGGDTTSQALGKHIAEIARIYEILNSMSTGGATIVTSSDTVLKAGEIGFDQDTGVLKVGDGVTAWGLLTGIRVVEVVDDLLSDSPEKALSAAQGKALKELIDAIPVVEIVDNLTVGGATKALSAEQGKTLKALVDTLETPVPGPPGPRGVEWRGAWDVATEYQKGDAVSHLGSSYIALKPSTGELPTNTEFWDTLSVKGTDGTGAGDMTKAIYDPDDDGKVLAAVMADTASVVPWDGVTGKPSAFGPKVIDTLDSDRTDAALAAKCGKDLKERIDEIVSSGVGAGVTTLDLSSAPNFAMPDMKIDSTAPVIAIPELGFFRYDAASAEIVDGETCLATENGVGRYLMLVPDASWLFMVAVRDARKIAEFMTYPKLKAYNKTGEITWTAINANGGVQEQDIPVPGISVADVISVYPPAGFVSGVVFNGYVKTIGVVTVRCVNTTDAAITPAKGTWMVVFIKEAR